MLGVVNVTYPNPGRKVSLGQLLPYDKLMPAYDKIDASAKKDVLKSLNLSEREYANLPEKKKDKISYSISLLKLIQV